MEMLPALLRRSIWWKYAAVLLSMAVFGYCLTQNAFLTPYIRYNGIMEHNESSAISLLLTGWSALPFFAVGAAPILFIYLFSLRARGWTSLRSAVPDAIVVGVPLGVALVAYFYHFGFVTPLRLLCHGGWLANPALVGAWVLLLFHSRRAALKVSLVAIIFMLSFLFIGDVPLGLKDEYVTVAKLGMGYWAWVASGAIMTIASLPFRRLQSLISRTVLAGASPD